MMTREDMIRQRVEDATLEVFNQIRQYGKAMTFNYDIAKDFKLHGYRVTRSRSYPDAIEPVLIIDLLDGPSEI